MILYCHEIFHASILIRIMQLVAARWVEAVIWYRWVLCAANLALQWRHNGHDSVSYHQPRDFLFNHLFRRRSKKTQLRVTGLCAGNSPGTGEFPAQMASNAENVCIWWRHHGRHSLLSVLREPGVTAWGSKFNGYYRWYWWLSARLLYLHGVSNGDIAVLH